MFTIDGIEYSNVMVSSLKRVFEVRDGTNKGESISGKSIRDITGTYFSYELTIDASLLEPDEYDTLFEILCAPVESHTVKFPYGQSTYEFEAEILSGSDSLLVSEYDYNMWGDFTITFQAIQPNRYPE